MQVGLLCENAAATQLAGCCLVLATRNAALRGERAPLQGRKAMAFEMSKLQVSVTHAAVRSLYSLPFLYRMYQQGQAQFPCMTRSARRSC